MSKSLPPHTLPIAHTQCHLQSYTFTAQLMGGELCFHGVFIWLIGKEKKQGFIEAQCGPLVTSRGSAGALQRFFFFFFCSFSLLLSAVLSFCSHTVWAFHCEVCSWFKEDTAHWSCIQRLQSSIWRGRWFTMLVRLISQWVKSFSVCMVLYVYGPNYDLAVRSSLLERAWRQIRQGQETDSHCDHLPLQGQILGLVKLWLWGSEHWKTVFVQNTLATLKTLHDLKTP